MCSKVQAIAEKRDKKSVCFLRFTRLVAKHLKATICFFEGEDEKYYSVRLNNYSFDWVGVDCKGKENVLALYKIITSHEVYSSYPVAFFVDRDFDTPLTSSLRDKIYETPCYSIENLYCSERSLRNILNAEFKANNIDHNIDYGDHVVLSFNNLRTSFHEHMRKVNVWIKAHREKEDKEGVKKLNLNNIKIESIIGFYSVQGPINLNYTNIYDFFVDCYNLSDSEISKADQDLCRHEEYLHFRGKWEIEFLRKYLLLLKKECMLEASSLYSGIKVKLSFSSDNFLSEISQYAETPDCLSIFIQKLEQDSLSFQEA